MTKTNGFREDGSPTSSGVTIYGAMWCKDTRRSRALLDRRQIDYTWVDVDEHSVASDWAAAQNNGQRRIPVIAVGVPGPILIEPSDDELDGALNAQLSLSVR